MTVAVDGPVPAYAFVAASLDRAEHLRLQPAALEALQAAARCIVVDDDGRAPVGEGDTPWMPDPATLRQEAWQHAVFLGLDADGRGWFACDAADVPDTPGGTWIDLRSAAAQWPALQTTAFAQARAVLHWRRRHRHCGACGARLAYLRAGWLGVCTACSAEHYPRTDPAVIVAVSDGERLLLGRQPGWAPRRWSVLAGFVEPGETLEAAVRREVAEETAIEVGEVTYQGSQPWPFPASLMLGCQTEAISEEITLDPVELQDALWISREDVVAVFAGTHPTIRPPRKGAIAEFLLSNWLADRLD